MDSFGWMDGWTDTLVNRRWTMDQIAGGRIRCRSADCSLGRALVRLTALNPSSPLLFRSPPRTREMRSVTAAVLIGSWRCKHEGQEIRARPWPSAACRFRPSQGQVGLSPQIAQPARQSARRASQPRAPPPLRSSPISAARSELGGMGGWVDGGGQQQMGRQAMRWVADGRWKTKTNGPAKSERARQGRAPLACPWPSPAHSGLRCNRVPALACAKRK